MRRRARGAPGAPDATIVYGTKAFPNVAIMKILWEEGIGADVSTLGEMMYAKAAGIPPSHWVVHGNNKSDEELKFAAENDAWLVVMDEPGEVERCVEFGVKRVLLRITPGIEAGGAREDHDRASGVEVRRAARGGGGDPGARARGRASSSSACTCTSGSQLMDDAPGACRRSTSSLSSAPALRAGRRRSSTWAAVSESGTRSDDAGAAEPDDTREYCASASAAERARQHPRSSSSPAGRLVGRAGVTLYRVGVVKRSGATTWVAVDGGMSDNPRPALYGARYSALLAEPRCRAGDRLVCDVWQALRER